MREDDELIGVKLTNGEAILDSVHYPELPPEKTWGTDALGNWGYADPSPLLEATTQLYPTRGETVYLPPSGFYSEPFMLSVNANPTSIVRCEFGGKPPHAQSQVYQEIPISATTVVRCASFNEGSLPGEIVSRTYVFEQQPSIATVFLTGDPDSWFNPDTGIYMEGPNAQASDPHYGANYWLDKEIPVFVELFEPGNVAPAFAENAAYKIFGNYSRANDKKSASITFKEKYGKKNEGKLSKSAMETLSIIAYSQPITRAEIEAIRGVSADNMVRLLMERNLIRETGKKDVPGKPIQYGTTKDFLKFFRLNSIADLPKLDETESERFELAR